MKTFFSLLTAGAILIAINCSAAGTETVQVGTLTKLAGSEGYSLMEWSADGTSLKAINLETDEYVLFDIQSGAKTPLVPAAVLADLQWYGFLPNSEQILYTKENDNTLYLMNKDGSGARSLWTEEYIDLEVSADGTELYLVVRNPQHTTAQGVALPTDIVVLRVADGSVARRFTLLLGTDQDGDSVGPRNLVVSPDLSRLAVDGGIVNSDGSGLKQVGGLFPIQWTEDSQFVISDGGCLFGSNGSEIFCEEWDSIDYTSDRQYYFILNLQEDGEQSGFSTSSLSVFDATGTNRRQLVDLKGEHDVIGYRVLLSPDDSRVAISAYAGIYLATIQY